AGPPIGRAVRFVDEASAWRSRGAAARGRRIGARSARLDRVLSKQPIEGLAREAAPRRRLRDVPVAGAHEALDVLALETVPRLSEARLDLGRSAERQTGRLEVERVRLDHLVIGDEVDLLDQVAKLPHVSR